MLYKSGGLEITPQVRSIPLGEKRKKGRPKKLPNCLVRSPVRAPTIDVPANALDISGPMVDIDDSLLFDDEDVVTDTNVDVSGPIEDSSLVDTNVDFDSGVKKTTRNEKDSLKMKKKFINLQFM